MAELLAFVLAQAKRGRLIEAARDIDLLFAVLDLLTTLYHGKESSLWSVPTPEESGPLCRFEIEWEYEAVEEAIVLAWLQALSQRKP